MMCEEEEMMMYVKLEGEIKGCEVTNWEYAEGKWCFTQASDLQWTNFARTTTLSTA